MSHMDDVRARQNDPTLFDLAEQKVRTLSERLAKTDIEKTGAQIQRAHSLKTKQVLLLKVADTFGEAMKGISPCGAGCNDCCHMALMITPEEAAVLSKASGRPWVMPPPEEFGTPDELNIARFDAVPCPLLKDGKCSVYDVRPWPCRMHYTLDRDNLLCKIIPGENIRTPSPDITKLNMLYYFAQLDPFAVKHADIRMYFP